MREILGSYDIGEMAHSGGETICCGSGGLVGIADPASWSRQAEVRMAEFRQVAAARCVTYCINRASPVRQRAGKVRHILELVLTDRWTMQQFSRSEAMAGRAGKSEFEAPADSTPRP
jgi:Fe-S oxidoreductase